MPARRPLAALIARSATSLCFVSEHGRRRFLSLLAPALRDEARARSLVQPMGVPAPTPRDVAIEPRPRSACFRLVSLGRLVPVKGLVEAAAALAHRGDLEWLVLGDGPLAGALRRLAARSRLRVSLLGNVTGDRKRGLLASADAFVLPSLELGGGRSEGAPHALLEAMALGLPVIAAAVGGVPELVSHGDSGLLFDPARPGQLEAAVDRLQGDAALRARLSAGARRAAEPHLWPAVAARFEAVLHPPPA